LVARLWWVRHGPTHQKTFTGWRDVPADLSDDAALSRLDAFLPQDALVVSSDLIRASATADRIAGRRKRLPDRADLREFDFGAWDGLGFEAVAARDPDLSRAFWDTPGDIAAPDGESFHDVGARVRGAIATLAADHPGADMIAVAHMGVILCHIGLAGGIGLEAALTHRIDPLSVTCLDRSGEGWTLRTVNHVA
jgi:alpha-ribazole phosphatase